VKKLLYVVCYLIKKTDLDVFLVFLQINQFYIFVFNIFIKNIYITFIIIIFNLILAVFFIFVY
jgi:hypothetical protein